MLDVKETNVLISRAKSGDNAAKEKLLTENANLIKSIVRRYLGKGVEYDDLYQLASMGLLKAINGFDESFGVRFSTYAVPMIAGEIKRFMRDTNETIDEIAPRDKGGGKGHKQVRGRVRRGKRLPACRKDDSRPFFHARKPGSVHHGLIVHAAFSLRSG